MVGRGALLAIVAWAVTVSCTKRNPDFCCIDDCADFGETGPLDCDSARVCHDNTCVPAECSTPAECPGTSPYCVGRLCVAACTGDSDCSSVPGLPHCDAEGVCVACADADDCPMESPVCAPVDHVCRGCTADSECAAGVCLEAEGTCPAEQDIVFVSAAGSDVGECTSQAPCETFTYALARITPQKRVIRLMGTDYATSNGILIDRNVYVDASDTALSTTGSQYVIHINNQAVVTLERIRVVSASTGALLLNDAFATLRSVQIRLSDPAPGSPGISLARSALAIDASEILDTSIECSASTATATLAAAGSSFQNLGKTALGITGSNCDVTVHRSNFDFFPLSLTGGSMDIANNVFTRPQEQGSLTLTLNGVTGTFRFNTIVDTGPSGLDNVIDCSGGGPDAFTSNIVAVKSSQVFQGGSDCPIKYSLFDSAAGTVPGTNNLSAAFGAIFVDGAGGDYHPAAASAALGAAEPGLDVTDDFDGNPRPQPAGANSDIGAYEVP